MTAEFNLERLKDVILEVENAAKRDKPADIEAYLAALLQKRLKERGGLFPFAVPLWFRKDTNDLNVVENGSAPEHINSSSGDLDEHFVPPKHQTRRASVSAESMTPQNSKWTKVVIPKTDAQKNRINNCIKNNFLFRHLEEEQRRIVMDAMFEKQVKKGDTVIKQGDEGDYFYVVETGIYEIWKSMDGGPEKKLDKEIKGEASFGELALMYNAPRAATIKAAEDGILWALDRVSFRMILMESTSSKRRMYESFLEEVPFLMSMEPYERQKIADALESLAYKDGEVVIKQGDKGEDFFIIESGRAKVTRVNDDGVVETVNELKRGEYFGELALLTNKPRQATVIAVGELKCAVLNRGAFDRLLGPCIDIIRRNARNYSVMKQRADLRDALEH